MLRSAIRPLALLLVALMPAAAAVDIGGADARAFLGGRTGKLVYLKNSIKQVYFVDFSDSALVERKVSDDPYCWSPMISPDGTRIVYESQSSIYIRLLEENSTQAFLVYSGVPTNGQSLEPHWWINPKTKEEYIIFCTGNVADLTWPPKSGKTFMQKIVNNAPSGPLLTLLPFMMASGRSKNGVWGATSHHSTGMYKLYADSVRDAFFSANNWSDSGGWGACNGSISPSGDPARQNRLMHLNSYLALANGETFENHKAIVIRGYGDKDLNTPLWEMGIPGIHCNNDSSGNLFWDHSEWSSNEDYFTAVGSKEIENWTEGDVYMGRIGWTGNNQIRRVLKGGGVNHYPNLWIKEGVAPARIQLKKSLVEFVSLKQDSANPRPDTVAVANSGDGTLPALKTGTLPAWLKVTVLANGTNAPKLVNAVDRGGLALGDYSAVVTVSFGQGADSAAYQVRFKYSDPVLTSLRVTPLDPALLPGDSVRFHVTALDQTGAPLSPQPAVTWSALDSLPITAAGTVVADSAWFTRSAFRATAGALACTTHVSIARHLLRIDAGSAADSAAPGWVADTASFAPASGGAVASSVVPLDPKAPADAGPDKIYRTVRQPKGAYRFASLPNGRYIVRLHFVSPFSGPAKPAGKLSVTVEGVPLLEDYSPPARPDSSLAADVREAQATVSDGDGLSLEFSGPPADVSVAGLEIFDIGALPIALLSPNGGDTAKVGDTLRVKWETDGYISSVGIQISPDSGQHWIPVTRRSSINQGQPGWGDFGWAIPDSLDGYSLATSRCLISVYDYFGTDRDRSDRAFTILPHIAISARFRPAPAAARIDFAPGRLLLHLPAGIFHADLLDARGRTAVSLQGAGPAMMELPTAGLPRGVYRLLITGPGAPAARIIPLLE